LARELGMSEYEARQLLEQKRQYPLADSDTEEQR
jgi:hypothetical protein